MICHGNYIFVSLLNHGGMRNASTTITTATEYETIMPPWSNLEEARRLRRRGCKFESCRGYLTESTHTFRRMLTYPNWQRDTAQNRDSMGSTPIVSTLAYPNWQRESAKNRCSVSSNLIASTA